MGACSSNVNDGHFKYYRLKIMKQLNMNLYCVHSREVLIVCLISITIQYFSFPKYLTNIYVLLPWENDLLFWLNYGFELLCMFLIVILWNCALAGFPFLAIYLEHTLRLMGSKVSQESLSNDPMRPFTTSTTHSNIYVRKSPRSRKLEHYDSKYTMDNFDTTDLYSEHKSEKQSKNRSSSSSVSVYEYSLWRCAVDYRQLVLYSNLMNEFQRYKLLCIHALLFGQQTAEAFTAFRMLREPGIALSDFAFLLTDMWVSFGIIFNYYYNLMLLELKCICILVCYCTRRQYASYS